MSAVDAAACRREGTHQMATRHTEAECPVMLANSGHDPDEAKFGDPYDTRAKSALHGVTIDNSFNLMEALGEVVLIASVDPVKTDLEVHCHFPDPETHYPCSTHLCDAEARDELSTLVRVVVAHFEEAHTED